MRSGSRPLEAVAQWSWPDDEVTHFKRLLDDSELNLLLLLGVVSEASNGAYFHGHVSGKAGVRLGSGLSLGTHAARDAERRPVETFSAGWLNVLHHESFSFEEFRRKWSNLVGSRPPVVTRSARGALASALRAKVLSSLPAPEQEQVWRRLFEATTLDDFETLRSLGLLVPHQPGAEVASLPLDASRVASLRKALDSFAGRDKSRFNVLPQGRSRSPRPDPGAD